MTRKERWFHQDGKLIHQKVTDPTQAIESAKALRENAGSPLSDSVHVARLDAHVVEMWVKEAGLKWDDRQAVRDLIKRKMLDSDNAAFRVWQGTY